MKILSFPKSTSAKNYDVVCFSHLRWDFVFQRPQHLLSRFARDHRVIFIEEPVYTEGDAKFVVTDSREGVMVAVPQLPHATDPDEAERQLGEMLTRLLEAEEITDFVAWYYTPMMLGWSRHLEPLARVYDCMDELSAFRNAPAQLREREAELFRLADLVFTGGRSLYEAKRGKHRDVYCFPSSIDVEHFAAALSIEVEPADQQAITRPRVGFAGVIDERTDIELLAAIADARPDWQFVMIGPVVKIAESDLPRRANIHYLGGKSYYDLPAYIGGWDVAMMPFAINESTRFISPTKTPEYLAAGRPVVSTPIRDVERPYGESGLVFIAENADEFVAAIEDAMSIDIDSHRAKAAEFLSTNSWDKTQQAMEELVDEVLGTKGLAASSGVAAGRSN